jgi:hypothetical protein
MDVTVNIISRTKWAKENSNLTSALKIMIACAVANFPEIGHEDKAEMFEFSAEDIGNIVYDILAPYESVYSSSLFLSGDNEAVL